MYVGLRTSDSLHKKIRCIGPELCTILQVNFRESMLGEVRAKGHATQVL